MSKQGSAEHRSIQSQRMRAWFAVPENRAAHAERQRKRFQTKEGKAHLVKFCAAGLSARRAACVIPKGMESWNDTMLKAGLSRADRLAAIAKAVEEEARRTGQKQITVEVVR